MNTFFMTAQKANSIVENLTKTMKNLKINFVRDLSKDEILRIIKRKNQTRVYFIEFYVSFSSFAFLIEIVFAITHVHVNAIDDQELNYQQSRFINCYTCDESNYVTKNCSHAVEWISSEKIYRNEVERWCYNRTNLKKVEMMLTRGMSRKDVVKRCLQTQSIAQNTTQVRALRLSDDSSSKKKRIIEKNMLMKIRATRQKHDSKIRKAFWRSTIEQSIRILKNKSKKKKSLLKIKNFCSENYLSLVVVEKMKILDSMLIIEDVSMRKIVSINSNSRIVKIKNFKQTAIASKSKKKMQSQSTTESKKWLNW